VTSNDEHLMKAVSGGDIDQSRRLLDGGASPDVRSQGNGWPALCVALFQKRGDMADLLLERGANPNSECVYETTIDRSVLEGTYSALRLAVRAGFPDLVRKLLNCGAQPNTPDSLDGSTPLYHAAAAGADDALLFLIKGGADVDAGNRRDGQTPLVAAIRNRHGATALVLIQAGAIPDAAALHEACARNRTDIADALVNAGVSVLEKLGRQSLLESAVSGGLGSLEWLLARPEGPRSLERDGIDAIRTAAHFGKADVLRRLVEVGVPVNCHDEIGWTPLIYAAWNGHADTVRALLEAGANPNLPDSTGKTAADWATRGKHIDIAKLLA
jgi:ankyrin repeat protein